MTVDLRTLLTSFNSDTGVTTSGGGLGTNSGVAYEGTAALEVQFSNSNEDIYQSSLTSRDLSDATLYGLARDNLVQSFANQGYQLILGDGTDTIAYDVGGSDAPGLPLPDFWRGLKLDVSVIVATPGSFTTVSGSEAGLDQTAVTEVGYGAIHQVKANGNSVNCFWDALKFHTNTAYAARVNGGTVGTPETMANVVADDETNGWGLFSNPVGSLYYLFGPTEWGEPAANADAYFEATDEQWILLGNNAGGKAVGAGNFYFRIIGNATDTISFVATRVTIINVSTRATFDMSSADVDTLQFNSCVFTDLGAITFPLQSAGNKFANDCIFNNCDRIDLSSCDMDGCVFNGTTDANGAIAWDENTSYPSNQNNLRFNSDGAGNAIEIAPTGAGPFTYNIDGYTFDGYALQDGTDADKIFYINPATSTADITINLTNSEAINPSSGTSGSAFSFRTAAGYTGTVTINQTVSLDVTVEERDGSPVDGARIRIEAATGGTLIAEGSTNSLGAFTASYNYAGDVDVNVILRLKGYLPQTIAATITNTGISVPVTFIRDPIVNLP